MAATTYQSKRLPLNAPMGHILRTETKFQGRLRFGLLEKPASREVAGEVNSAIGLPSQLEKNLVETVPTPKRLADSDKGFLQKSRFSSEEIEAHINQRQLELIKLLHRNWYLNSGDVLVFEERRDELKKRTVREQARLISDWSMKGMKTKDIAYVLDMRPHVVKDRLKYGEITELVRRGVAPEEIAKELGIKDLAKFYCGNRMSEEQQRQALEHRKKGYTFRESGEILNFNPGTIRYYLIKAGAHEIRNKRFTKTHYKAALEGLSRGYNLVELGRALDFDPNTIKYHFIKHNDYISAKKLHMAREAKATLMKEHGCSNGDIAKELGVEVSTVNRKFGSDFEGNMQLSDEKIRRIVELRSRGLFLGEISDAVCSSRQCISRYLKRTKLENTHPILELTEKQLRITWLTAQGLINKEVGLRLNITENVTKNYLRVIYDKVGVSDRLELSLWANKYIKLIYSVNGHSRPIDNDYDLSEVNITPKQLVLLGHLKFGYSDREIADKIHMKIRTVKSYLAGLCKNAGINGGGKRIRVVLWAEQNQNVKRLLECFNIQ